MNKTVSAVSVADPEIQGLQRERQRRRLLLLRRQQVVALAVLMPIVASMGGNAGTQSLTVAVRAIATKDLTGSNLWRVIRREVLVGLVNGVAFAVVMGVIGVVWFGLPLLGHG